MRCTDKKEIKVSKLFYPDLYVKPQSLAIFQCNRMFNVYNNVKRVYHSIFGYNSLNVTSSIVFFMI